jgi:hypothetical protein
MEAGGVGRSFTPDARIAVSHEADTVTGSKPANAAPGSDSSPRSKARRHLNTWFAFTPCALATKRHARAWLQRQLYDPPLLCN